MSFSALEVLSEMMSMLEHMLDDGIREPADDAFADAKDRVAR